MSTLTSDLIKELFPHGKLLLCGYRGSVAHNTYIPSTNPLSIDDIDIMGVYLAPVRDYLSYRFPLKYTKGTDRFIEEWDAVSYELKHYLQLLTKQNPSALSLLWVEDEHYLPLVPDNPYRTWGKLLLDNRNIFRAKTAYNSFVGYARGQLKRMTHYQFEGYMGEKRKTLVDKFGYDTKNASHLIRLLTMGVEFLQTGELKIYRTKDKDKLCAIKRGEWTLEQIQNEAENLFEQAKIAKDNSFLPEEIDEQQVNNLYCRIMKEYLCGGVHG